MIGLVAAFLLAWALGYVAVAAVLGGGMRCSHGVLRATLAAGAGVGLASCCFFLSLVTGVPDLVIEAALFAGLAAWWWFGRRTAACPLCEAARPQPWTRLERWLAIAFSVAAALAACAFVFATWREPHGEWDAWSIWNMKARFFYRDPAHWRDVFTASLNWVHPDYPLLLPAFVARCWRFTGSESLVAPAAAAFVFTFGALGLLVSAVSTMCGRSQGFIAGLLMLTAITFIGNGATQYADVPLAFYMLAALSLAAMQPGSRAVTALAGLMAALAAWTKNEGLVLIAALIAARALIAVRAGQGRAALRQLPAFASGAAPVLLLVAYFKTALATPNLTLGQLSGGSIAGHLADPFRYVAVAEAALEHLWSFGGLPVSPVLIVVLYLALAGRGKQASPAACWTLGIMAAAYGGIYVVSNVDVNWLIETSMDRLMLQLWPSAVFAAALAARNPAVVAGRAGSVTRSSA